MPALFKGSGRALSFSTHLSSYFMAEDMIFTCVMAVWQFMKFYSY